MKIVATAGKPDVAIVYIAELQPGKLIEFVESVQPPVPRNKKWVLILSTLYGCPVKCLMCDAGNQYQGKLSKAEIFAQVDFLINNRFPGQNPVPVEKLKIQFARLGEPSFNPNVLEVLEELPDRFSIPGLIPSLSTVAPVGTELFFERLLQIKNKLYSHGKFQLQFSIHTTDLALRDKIVPVRKWDFAHLARYGEKFYQSDSRKITLNFALAQNTPVEPQILRQNFDPAIFLIKITPLNPTYTAGNNRLSSYIDPCNQEKKYQLVDQLRTTGYEVLVSIGEVEENYIGSNCGQFLIRHIKAEQKISSGYTYQIQPTH